MSYKYPEADNITKYKLLTRQGGLANREIRTLTGCCNTKASKIIFEIHCEMAKHGVKPNPKLVSRNWFCKYMGWDFEEIERFARAEMQAMQISKTTSTAQ